MLKNFLNKPARIELVDGTILIGEITDYTDGTQVVEIECDLFMFEPVYVHFEDIEKIIARG